VSAGATIAGSLFVKQGNTTWLRIIVADTGPGYTNGVNVFVNVATGALSTVSVRGTATAVSASIQAIGNGWYRVVGMATLPGGSVTAAVAITTAVADNNNTRVNNGTYYAWGGQTEVGAYGSSYMPTGAVSATRPTESANISNINTAPWFNPNAGTLMFEWDTVRSSVAAGVPGGFSAGSFANTLYWQSAGWNILLASTGGTATSSAVAGNGVINKQIGNYGASLGVQGVNNGFPPNTNNVYNVANAPFPWTNLCFGSSPWSIPSGQESGHIRRGRYWKSALTLMQMQAISR
jgi:hypothetical protein